MTVSTLSPCSSRTTSPGTSSVAGSVRSVPSRTTVTGSTTSCASAPIARAARLSCAKPMSALSTTTASTTSPSVVRPSVIATAAEIRSVTISGLRAWRSRRAGAPGTRGLGQRVGAAVGEAAAALFGAGQAREPPEAEPDEDVAGGRRQLRGRHTLPHARVRRRRWR